MQSIFIKNRRNHTNLTTTWEQRELRSVFTIRNEKNGDRYSREDVLAVSDTYGCVNQIKFHGRSFAGEDISNYKVVRTGDIVYTKSPLQAKPYGIIKIVGEETGIISPLYVVNETIEGIDPMFMYYLFDTPERTNNYLSPLVRKGAKNTMNISNEEWLSGIVTISPNEEEQRAIGNYFKSLDNLITLHQRKYSLLFIRTFEILKEACFFLNVNAWEQRKLGDVASNFEYGLNASAKEFDGENKYIRITDIDDESRVFLSDDITSPDTDLISADKYKLEKGDILFARTGASVGKTYLYREKDGLVYYAGFLIRAKINPENDAEFVFQNTLTDSYDSFIRITSQRSGQPGVNAQEYQGFSFYVPSLKEQQLIGTYFKNLDSLITLHQRKPFQRKNGGKNYVRRC